MDLRSIRRGVYQTAARYNSVEEYRRDGPATSFDAQVLALISKQPLYLAHPLPDRGHPVATFSVTYEKTEERQVEVKVVGAVEPAPVPIMVRDSLRYTKCETKVAETRDEMAIGPSLLKYSELFALPGACSCGKGVQGHCYIYLLYREDRWHIAYGLVGDPCLSMRLGEVPVEECFEEFRKHGANVPEPCEMREALWKFIERAVFFPPEGTVIANGIYEKGDVFTWGSSKTRELLNAVLFQNGGSRAESIAQLRVAYDKTDIRRFVVGWYGSPHRPMPRILHQIGKADQIAQYGKCRLTWVIPDPSALSFVSLYLFLARIPFDVRLGQAVNNPVILPTSTGGMDYVRYEERDYPVGRPVLVVDAWSASPERGRYHRRPWHTVGLQHGFMLKGGRVVAVRSHYVRIEGGKPVIVSAGQTCPVQPHVDPTEYIKSHFAHWTVDGWLFIGMPHSEPLFGLRNSGLLGSEVLVPYDGYMTDLNLENGREVMSNGVVGFYEEFRSMETPKISHLRCLCGRPNSSLCIQDADREWMLADNPDSGVRVGLFHASCPHMMDLRRIVEVRDGVGFAFYSRGPNGCDGYYSGNHGDDSDDEAVVTSDPCVYPIVTLDQEYREDGGYYDDSHGPNAAMYVWFVNNPTSSDGVACVTDQDWSHIPWNIFGFHSHEQVQGDHDAAAAPRDV